MRSSQPSAVSRQLRRGRETGVSPTPGPWPLVPARSAKRSRVYRWAAGLAVAGALVVGPSLVLQGDYREAFLQAKGRLRETREAEAGRAAGTVTREVRLVATTGLEITARVRAPEGSGGRRPAVLLLGGVGRGRMALEHVATTLATDQIVLAAMDYPYQGERRLSGLALVRALPEVRRSLFRSVAGIMLVVDYLVARPDVDAARIAVVGMSFGSPFAVVAGAVDGRIGAVASLFGGGDIPRLVAHNLGDRVPVGRWAIGWLAGALLAPVEPLRYAAAVAPRPLLMINGREDERIPAESVEELYARARDPKRIIWLDTRHPDPGTHEIFRTLAAETAGWLADLGWVPGARAVRRAARMASHHPGRPGA